MTQMTKRERLEATILGEAADRTPVALWRHFPGDDQRPEDLAAATVAFQHRYDFDFVKVTPASSFCLRNWGAQDLWMGNTEGTRDYIHYPIQSPEDWHSLRPADPAAGALGAQLSCLRLIAEGLDNGDEVPFIQTIFSPLAQARQGQDLPQSGAGSPTGCPRRPESRRAGAAWTNPLHPEPGSRHTRACPLGCPPSGLAPPSREDRSYWPARP